MTSGDPFQPYFSDCMIFYVYSIEIVEIVLIKLAQVWEAAQLWKHGAQDANGPYSGQANKVHTKWTYSQVAFRVRQNIQSYLGQLYTTVHSPAQLHPFANEGNSQEHNPHSPETRGNNCLERVCHETLKCHQLVTEYLYFVYLMHQSPLVYYHIKTHADLLL